MRKFYPEVRLRRLLKESGGSRREDMIDRAAERLEEIRAKCLTAIDAKVERVSGLALSTSDEGIELCYDLSNEIFAEAGTFDLTELSAAAHSLCSLLSAGNAPAGAIRVHVDAMRALRRPEIAGNKHMRAAVLAELRGLVDRIRERSKG